MNEHTCKHYNGDYHNKTCRAGVCYLDVTTDPDKQFGIAFRKPCIDWNSRAAQKAHPLSDVQQAEFDRRGKCEKFELPTAAEIAAEEVEARAYSKKVDEAYLAIITELERRHAAGDANVQFNKFPTGDHYEGDLKNFVSGNGFMVCPICKTGSLRYSRAAYNGHVHGRCSTDGCVAWMQ